MLQYEGLGKNWTVWHDCILHQEDSKKHRLSSAPWWPNPTQCDKWCWDPEPSICPAAGSHLASCNRTQIIAEANAGGPLQYRPIRHPSGARAWGPQTTGCPGQNSALGYFAKAHSKLPSLLLGLNVIMRVLAAMTHTHFARRAWP